LCSRVVASDSAFRSLLASSASLRTYLVDQSGASWNQSHGSVTVWLRQLDCLPM
jgi:hypothetical protein